MPRRRSYFGVSARRLTPGAGGRAGGPAAGAVPLQPSGQPRRPRWLGRKEVLTAMVEAGAITADQAQAAAAQIVFPPSPMAPGWFADWVAEQSQSTAGAGRRRGISARRSTAATRRWPRQGSAALLDGPGAAANVGQGAVVILDAAIGRGAGDGRRPEFSRQPVQPRRPGPAAAGLGVQAVRLADRAGDRHDARRHGAGRADPHRELEPGEFRAPLFRARSRWRRRWRSRSTPPRSACCCSPAAPRPSPPPPLGWGSADKLPNDASLALGTGEVGLLELTAAYAPFFNGGNRVTPFGLDRDPAPAGAGDRARAWPR